MTSNPALVALLAQRSEFVRSRMGFFAPGQRVIFRGKDLHTELGSAEWMRLYVFGITGRQFSENEIKLLNAIWTYTSYPDVRLWNNRVAALAASTRSSATLGLGAALAVSEAKIYGRGIDFRAIRFLQNTRAAVAEGALLGDCVRRELTAQRSIAGYGRPIINGDERNPHMLKLAASLGLDKGPYLALAGEIDEFLRVGRLRIKMNYGGLVAALAADLGFSAREYHLFMFPAFLAGMPPCLVESSEQPAGTLYALACDDVVYEGAANRDWIGRRPRQTGE